MFLSALVTAYFWLFLFFFVGLLVNVSFETVIHARDRTRKFSNLKNWLPGLLRQGYDGSYLSLTDRQTGRTLKFHKYIRGEGQYGLEFQIHESEWVESARRKLEALAEKRKLERRIETSTGHSPGRDTLVLDFGRDIDEAYEFAATIWSEIFDLGPRARIESEQDEWEIGGQTIDGPNHPPPISALPHAERAIERMARLRKAGGPGCLAMLGITILTLSLCTSAIGFPIAMLLARGEAVEWTLDLGVMSLDGTDSSLAWFALFFVSFWPCQSLSEKLRNKFGSRAKAFTAWERRIGRTARLFAFTLPVAAFLAWAGF